MQKLQLFLGLCAAVGFGAYLQVASQYSWIYVDNGRAEPMVVTIDGKNPVEIPPGQCKQVVCDVGERVVKVTCGSEVIFQAMKDMQKSDHWGICRKFLLNPDQTHRYGVYTVHYGKSSFLRDQFKKLLTPDGQREQDLSLEEAYRSLTGELKLQPDESWFEITKVDCVLTAPPESVTLPKHSSSAERDVLTRVSPEDYAVLANAKSNQEPTEEDFVALATAVERVFDEAP
ncbi:MAG: hypothetical protein AABP62_25740 [Planctomycetota bacterium]